VHGDKETIQRLVAIVLERMRGDEIAQPER
jgi:hypothetical protein